MPAPRPSNLLHAAAFRYAHSPLLLFRFLKLIISALFKLPACSTTLYRGVKRALAQLGQKFEKGKPVVWWSVSSTASHVGVLENPQFMGKTGSRCMFNITSHSARDIQRYSAMGSAECEYALFKLNQQSAPFSRMRRFVLPPGCCLMVEDILDAGSGLTIVQLTEDKTKMLLKFTMPSASGSAAGGGAVHAAQAAAVHTSVPVSLPPPDRYLVCPNQNQKHQQFAPKNS